MPRLPINKTKKLAEAESYGHYLGKMKALKKVKLNDAVKLRVLDMIDRVDPVKISAIAGLAYIFKFTLDGSQEWVKEKSKLKNLAVVGVIPTLLKWFGKIDPDQSLVDLELPDLIEWIICLSFAYLCIEKPDLITDGILKFALAVLPK